jgi:hypothetical protein
VVAGSSSSGSTPLATAVLADLRRVVDLMIDNPA